ncbi:FAD-dependent thymidylate synthase [Halanaerobiaceae bacterium Z-7014]|uniref:Flavin-dependent thymidylate synthase n=1 Tax=Halonatronomonas betaini TaxID=2778430 RepID=A0A931AWJ2_9FIRM|nr:FAD-dependent thymidylate synthase [Halonatronomonas betaini]MBF8437994.1 FAD-dependent thymidylate synthase [Halonatronomonas betaini]
MIVEPSVELIDYTEDPEMNVAVAARLCYSEKGNKEIRESLSKEKKEALIKKILDLGHYSTLEHTFFSFHIVCSRVTSHQLVRQRVGVSYSQRSQRYVKEDNFDFIIPPKIKNKGSEAVKVFKDHYERSRETYNELLDQGIPPEDARFVLPAVKTNLIASYNARSLYHLFSLRCCARAQWEIREIARDMLEQVKSVAPLLFSKAGADCEAKGVCPEGDLSCGRIENLDNINGDNNG